MPTVLLVDVSLSMCRHLTIEDSPSPMSVKVLANQGISTLLDYLSENAKLEYTSFMLFSSLWELRVPFTRDVQSIKSELGNLETFDKTNIINALNGALSLKLHDWTQNGPVNIILVTDGQMTDFHDATTDSHPKGGKSQNDEDFSDISLDSIQDSFDFPCKLQVVCIASPNEPSLRYATPFYKKLIATVDRTTRDSTRSLVNPSLDHAPSSGIWLPNCGNFKNLTKESVLDMFRSLAELHYKPFNTTLTCGNISSLVMLYPKPNSEHIDDLSVIQNSQHRSGKSYKFGNEITIYGFLPVAEVASPPVLSRHIVIPLLSSKYNETVKAEQILSQDPNAYDKVLTPGSSSSQNCTPTTTPSKTQEPSDDDDKQPSFCVLLHNSLKSETMVAICQLSKDEWYGMLHTSSDSKKKSCLMLSTFRPGPECIPWIHDLRTLGLPSISTKISLAEADKEKAEKKSYSSNCVIWLEPESLQSDCAKLLRHAKRLPEKNQHFYKELNKYRKAALSYGFFEALYGLADILDNERKILESNDKPNQQAIAQLAHAAAHLRERPSVNSYDTIISPA